MARLHIPGFAEALQWRIAGLFAALIAANLAVWAFTLAILREHPVLLGTALLAYTFGLRHAIDADHIAAIDNATRKLMREGQTPLTLGLFFSLGHSTVVVLASAAIAATASALDGPFAAFRAVGGLIGTLVSSGFLVAIAFANILILAGLWRAFRCVRQGGRLIEEDLDGLLVRRGLLGRMFRPVFGMIRKGPHMYPLGLLFGLGFDTATEIGVLGLSASGAAQGLSIWTILIFPALFTAGMTLVDTADNVLMVAAYGWAAVKPMRKLYYNLTITFVSVAIALLVASVQMLGLIGERLGLDHGLWGAAAILNENSGTLGAVIVGLFAASWLVSVLIYRAKGYHRIEALRG